MTNTEKWATVGASAVMLAILWILLRRRNKLKKAREDEMNKPL